MATPVICRSIAFTISRSIFTVNGKPQKGYAIVQNEKLQIMSDGNFSETFNLKDLISVNIVDNISEFKYELNASFQSQSKCETCVEVDLYTNDESIHDTFHHCFFNIILMKKWTPDQGNDDETDDKQKPQKSQKSRPLIQVETASDQDNNDESDDKQASQPLIEEKKLEVALYERACQVCGFKYCAEKLYFCAHEDCPKDQQKIVCAECGLFSHKKRSHPFYTDKEYIVCVGGLMNPDVKKFKSGKLDGELLQRGIKSVQQILFRQRWLLGVSSYSLGMGGATGASVLINGTPIVMAACADGSKVIGSALGVAALGAGIGTVIGTAIEWAYIGRQLYKKRISKEEAIKLGVTAFVANGVSAGTYFGCMAIGAALGTPLGPIGSVIGAIAAATAVGLGTRYAVNKGCEKYYKRKHSKRTQFLKEALKFFFDNEQFDIMDGSKFNEKILKRRYHRLAVIYHPDRKDGDHSEWLKLSAYYGILTAVFESQTEAKQKSELSIEMQH